MEVVSAYRFYMYDLARELAKSGALKQLHTALPSRLIPEVSHRLVRSRPVLAGLRHLLGRTSPQVDAFLTRAVYADFDRWTARGLRGASVVTALSACATATLRRASANGAKTVCDRGSSHILDQKAVLDEESEKWSLPGPSFDNWLIDRELQDYESADRIIVPSTASAQSFFRRGFDSHRVRVVPFGADLQLFAPTSHRPSHNMEIVCVGHIGLRKGQQYLIGAYRRVRRRGTSLRLVGVVDRRLLQRLRVVEDDIRVVGPVPRSDVPREMRRASIFALASVEEGLALVIPQAMSCGLPIIATEATGASDIVDHGVEGLVVPTGDEDALAEALERLLDNPDEALEMGRAARTKMESFGGWQAYGQRSLKEFTELARAQV